MLTLRRVHVSWHDLRWGSLLLLGLGLLLAVLWVGRGAQAEVPLPAPAPEDVAAPLAPWLELASPQTTGSPRGLATGDFDGDGMLDIVAANDYAGGLNAWRGDGGNSWVDDGLATVATTGQYESLLIGRFDLSSVFTGVVAARWDYNGGLHYWRRWSEGTIQHGWWDEVIASTGQYRGLSYGDVDGDGTQELVSCKWDGGIQLWERGPNVWQTQPSPTTSGTYYDTALGDVNNDGKPDIVAASYDGLGVRVYSHVCGPAACSWQTSVVTRTGIFYAVAVGELTGDKNLDIVAAVNNSDLKGIYVWQGDGGTSWTPIQSPASTSEYFDLDLGDFDNDSRLELLAARDGLGLGLWRRNGDGSWASEAGPLPASGAFFNALYARIDADSKLDIVATQLGSGLRMWVAAEAAPPSFSSFRPSGWITTTQNPTLYVSLLDSASGLAVGSGQVSFSRDGGATWSAPAPVPMSGIEGTKSLQTITATVNYGQDSGNPNRNRVRFYAKDVAGNLGMAEYAVRIDTTPPTVPASASWSGHAVSTWTKDNVIALGWSASSDVTSGVGGYAVSFDTFASTLPAAAINSWTTSYSSSALGTSSTWYAHVRAVDVAGNWSPTARHAGPYRIDVTPPSNPSTLSSSSDTVGVWSNDNTIAMSWSGAGDVGSGVSGYSTAWDTSTSTTPPATVNNAGTSALSPALATGSHYFHLRTRDVVGNWAGPIHRGPYRIDVSAPNSSTTSPGTSGSNSFTVSWAGTDAGCGVISTFDIQYRDLSAGGAWTTWRSAVSYDSDTFYGQAGHVYQFRSRGRDQVGNLEAYPASYDSQTAVATVDFTANRIEVNQSVQDLNNSVRLIAGKRTFVRFHVRSSINNFPGVAARLRVYRGSTYMGTLLPANAGAVATLRTSPDRAQRDQSFYFDVPVSWLGAGSVSFYGDLNPAHTWAESSYGNNTASATTSFSNAPDMNLLIVDIPYWSGGVVRHIRTADYTQLEAWLRAEYPISRLNTWWGYRDPPSSLPSAGTVDADLNWYKSNKVLGASEDPYMRYYGMAIDTGGFMRGLASGLVASGPTGNGGWDNDGSYGDWYGTHELGHTYGRAHVRGAPDCGADGCCGHEGGPDPSYPYPGGNISPNAVGDGSNLLYGFNTIQQVVYPPTWKDLMTYCPYEWISKYNYEAIYNRMVSEKPVSAAQVQALKAAGSEHLAVFATIITPTDVITLHAFYRVPDAFDVFGRIPGPYSIRFLGDGSATLANYPFTPRWEEGIEEGGIAEYVPWVNGTRVVQILHGAKVLAARTVNPTNPTVKLVYPNGGESLGGTSVTVRWSSSSGCTYALEYSRDGGATWTPLSNGLTGTEATLSLARLPGSAQGRFRIWASDGVNTAIDASDGDFSVPGKSPQVEIVSPQWAIYVYGQTITFDGFAYDAEDGPLSGAALQWSSNLAGVLGSGRLLQLTDVVTGTHTITLTAKDSSGLYSQATTLIRVGEPSAWETVSLPLVMRR